MSDNVRKMLYDTPSPAPDSIGRKYAASWHHSAIRVTKPTESIGFYSRYFGMSLVYGCADDTFTSYFLATLKKGETYPSGLDDADKFVKNFPGTFLVLHYDHKTPAGKRMNSGNVEPDRGFGHIAFNCNDVYAAAKKLELSGVQFKKRPDEGKMKGLAFALDPDGYWIEIVGRGDKPMTEEFNLSQTMIRVKDPKISIPFYRDTLGMTIVREMHMSDFSNYFLASLPADTKPPVGPDHPDARDFVHSLFNPTIELTHNHGTENQSDFHYHNGNTHPIGFSHLAFRVNDIKQFAGEKNLPIKAKGDPRPNRVFADAKVQEVALSDPDGYVIKLFDNKL